MRTKNALKNVVISLGTYSLLLVVGLFLRRLLLNTFDLELVAYDGLLSNVFSFIAIADLGAGSLFNYRLYKAFADEDQERINQVMSMFRTLYRAIGFLVMLLCGLIFLLLPVLFAGKVHQWGYFRFIYVVYSISTLASYFLGYWQALLVAGQKEYVVTATQTTLQIFTQFAKAIVLCTTGSYLLYIVITGFTGVMAQILVAYRSKKEYSQVSLTKSSLADYKEDGILRELYDVFVIRIAGTVMYSTDSLLITFLINTETVALYGNYGLISNYMSQLINRLILPIRATLADVIHKEDKETSYLLYRTSDLCCFFFSSILFVCYTVVFQSAITVFFGEQFLLSQSFVLCYALQFYINTKNQIVRQMRDAFGEYPTERRYTILGAVINITVSIVLSRIWGLSGIVIGTIIALLSFWHSYFTIVDQKFFGKRVSLCWIREIMLLLLAAGELGITWYLTRHIAFGVWGMILRGVIGVSVPTLINLLIFFRTPEFKNLLLHARVALNRKNSSDTPEAE